MRRSKVVLLMHCEQPRYGVIINNQMFKTLDYSTTGLCQQMVLGHIDNKFLILYNPDNGSKTKPAKSS